MNADNLHNIRGKCIRYFENKVAYNLSLALREEYTLRVFENK
jgi:hypothetical protein